MLRAIRRIAVVDDDAAVRKALMRLLEISSFDVQGFPSARDLLRDLTHSRPDCMILDLQMPNMSGLDLQQHLNRSGIRIPTVVVTAHDEPGARERCLATGAAAYLLKPIYKAALLKAIGLAIES